MVARILAVVVSVAMVVGAIQVRQRMDDGDGGGGRRDPGADDGRPAVIVCSTEVAAVCEGSGSAAPAPATAAGLGRAADVDVWLTAGPWGEIVDDARRRAGDPELFRADDRVVARSPLVLVLHRTRGQELRSKCPAPITWRCVGDAAGAGVLVAAATTAEAEGVLIRAAAAAGYLGRSDYDRNDLEADPALLPWLQGLDRATLAARQSGATDYARFLQIPGAAGYITYDAAATAVPQGFEKVVLEPRATVDVVLSARRKAPDAFTDRLSALFQSGWKRPNEPSVRGDDGLPSAGVLQALQEVIR